MNDLISRSALIDFLKRLAKFLKCEEFHKPKTRLIGNIINYIEKQPAADAVEVVRCKECTWFEKAMWHDGYRCGNPSDGMASGVELQPNDYCSYGERRNGDGSV